MKLMQLTDIEDDPCLINFDTVTVVFKVDDATDIYVQGSEQPVRVKESFTTILNWIKDYETRTRT